MPALDVIPSDLATVRAILQAVVPELEVRAFGSRVAGTPRPTSDLDIALMTATPLDLDRLATLREAFTESALPFKVDVLDWAATSAAFRAIVGKTYSVIQPAPPWHRRGP